MKRNDQLNAILDSLLPMKLSLRTFVIEYLRSKDKRIIGKVRHFYASEGLAHLMNIWMVQVHKNDNVKLMLRAATDLLIKHCTMELNDASMDPRL